MPKSMQPESIEILLLIRIIGCLDILLLCAYLAVCIHDRTGQEKAMDIASARSHFSGRADAMKILRLLPFLSQELADLFLFFLYLVLK